MNQRRNYADGCLVAGLWHGEVPVITKIATRLESLSNQLAECQRDIADLNEVRQNDIDEFNHVSTELAALKAEMNKLSEQEPVAWLQTSVEDGVDTVIARTHKPDKFNAEWWRFDPLYLHPAPSVPKGWTAIHLKTGNEYQVIGEAIDATNMHCNQLMVIYQRDGKTFVREAEEFQEKFKASVSARSK